MRPQGRAAVSVTYPQAHAICDRCGFRYLHRDLQWQFDWRGARTQNLRILVCASCYDRPQENGQRTIILPPDPVPIANPRPENYAVADNPVSFLGWNPRNLFSPGSSQGANSGTLTHNAGVNAAFDGATNKRTEFCASLVNSVSSFGNTVIKNWNGDPTGITAIVASTVASITHTVSSFTAYAPNDQPFLRTGPTGWRFEGSTDGTTWTTLSSGTTAGNTGEVLGVTVSSSIAYPFHRFNLQGNGINPVAVAQVLISVSDAFQNEF